MAKVKTGSRLLFVWHAALLLAGLSLIVRHDLGRAEKGIRMEPTIQELRELFAEEARPEKAEDPLPHFQGMVKSKGEMVPAACVATAELPPEVKGYVDQVNALVVIDQNGIVHEVRVLDHRETPGYVRRVVDSGFLEKFRGKDVTEGFDDIDAVTGASITAKAIKDDVAAAAALAGRRLYGLRAPGPKLPSWGSALLEPVSVAVLIGLIAALYARFGRWPRRFRREAAWVLSILLIGIYAMTPYTLVHTFQSLELDLPGPGNAVLAVLLGFVLVTTVLFGPIWCAYACPFGALQELIARIPVRRWRVTSRLMRRARELRYLVLFASVAGFFGLGVPAFARVEPFFHLFSRTREPVAWAFIGAVLFSALFIKRFWCRLFCPTGACLVMLSAHRKYLKRIERGVSDSGIDAPDMEQDEK